MPHQCTGCGALFADDAAEILRGCACGAKSFLFVRPTTPGIARDAEGVFTVDVQGLFLPNVSGDVAAVDPKSALRKEATDGVFEIDIDRALRDGDD